MRTFLRLLLLCGVLLACFAYFQLTRPLEDVWLHDMPGLPQMDQFHSLTSDRVFFLEGPHVQKAEQKLADRPLVVLSDQEFKWLCPSHANTKYASLKPYLVRCVSTGYPSTQCRAEVNGSVLWISCGMLTHYPVTSVEHTPAIVLLAKAPKDVYVTFSQAE